MLLGIELAFLLQLSHAERAAVFHFALGDGSGHANGNAIWLTQWLGVVWPLDCICDLCFSSMVLAAVFRFA